MIREKNKNKKESKKEIIVNKVKKAKNFDELKEIMLEMLEIIK